MLFKLWKRTGVDQTCPSARIWLTAGRRGLHNLLVHVDEEQGTN